MSWRWGRLAAMLVAGALVPQVALRMGAGTVETAVGIGLAAGSAALAWWGWKGL